MAKYKADKPEALSRSYAINRKADAHSFGILFPGSDFSDAEAEWLREAERYREKHGRLFMKATDYLQLLLSLGYRKVEAPPPDPQ